MPWSQPRCPVMIRSARFRSCPAATRAASTGSFPNATSSSPAATSSTYRIAFFMGGRASEEMILGDISTTAEDDLQRASVLARRMVAELGMSVRLGPMSVKADPTAYEPTTPSPRLLSDIDDEILSIFREGEEYAKATITENRAVIDQLVAKLVEVESLEGEVLDAFLSGVVAPQMTARVHAAP